MRLIKPDWPAPSHIKAFSTTRQGGVSQPPFNSLNLGSHVNDNPQHVLQNRELLIEHALLPASPLWLSQIHGTDVIDAADWYEGVEADACTSQQNNHLCSILTADCLPILMCDIEGKRVAAIHAGWRGLLNGIIENTVQQFSTPTDHILTWLGPAIGPKQFEVGLDVYTAFTSINASSHSAFQKTDDTHFLANIYTLAKLRLNAMGINQVYGGEYCTVSDSDSFFSYRRDKITGRMASIIWIDNK